jgi:hypothetical protein
MIFRLLRSSLFVLSIATAMASAQTFSPSADPDRPIPDVSTLMHDVEGHQRAAESIEKDYLYHEVAREQRSDGKKMESREFDVFWLNGVRVHKLTRKDGKDLTADEQRKESERIDKDVAKAKNRKDKADARGAQTDSNGREEITVSRFLELGAFTNPRRLKLNGRETIAIDYTGDPKAKTRNRMEDVIRDLSGTIWIDDEDRSISRLEGRFANAFKVGGGLLMSIKKGTSFSMEQMKINDEVWLPSKVEGRGGARVMLVVNFDGSVLATNSDYRKFKATSTILPGISTVKEPSADEGEGQPDDSKAPASPH